MRGQLLKDEFNRSGPVLHLLLRYTRAPPSGQGGAIERAARSGRTALDLGGSVRWQTVSPKQCAHTALVDTNQNCLIALLSRRDRAALLDISESVELELGTVLCEPGEPTRHVYFPIDSFISLVAAIEGGSALEVGMVGREGMLGAQLVLGVNAMALHALVQGAGTARRIAAARFRRELSRSSSLQLALKRYVHVLMTQLATSAACTRFHSVEPRLARWLLMTQDRAHSDSFHLTHEFLAHMLGVRRVGITGAASDLQRSGLIRYHRGEIAVLDRAGLEAAACSCYGADRQAYDGMLGRSRSRQNA
jgi:CRP-like cAMP-binding protein